MTHSSNSSFGRFACMGMAAVAIVVSPSCRPKANWQAYTLNGLKMQIPAATKPQSQELPEATKALMEEFKMEVGDWDRSEITLSYSRYNVPCNLEGGFKGAVDAIRGSSENLVVTQNPVKISGRDGMEGRLKFTKSGQKLEAYLLLIVDKNQLWQVILASPEGEMNGADEKVKASLSFD